VLCINAACRCFEVRCKPIRNNQQKFNASMLRWHKKLRKNGGRQACVQMKEDTQLGNDRTLKQGWCISAMERFANTETTNLSGEAVVAFGKWLLEHCADIMNFCCNEMARCCELEARESNDECWHGITVYGNGNGNGNGIDISAPAHMDGFSCEGVAIARLTPQQEMQRYEIQAVRACYALSQLLLTNYLDLGVVSVDYMKRIAAFEYARYELAVGSMITETLIPLGVAAGVSFESGLLVVESDGAPSVNPQEKS
jgi:hypothetical protein